MPTLRFPEFEEEWIQFSLQEICIEFKSGYGITSEKISEVGSYPVYGGNGLRGYTDSFTHDGNYLLIGRQGALCGNINRSYGKSYISEHAIAVLANEQSDTEWLAQRLEYLELNRLSESSAQPGLAVNKLLKLKIFVPKKEEQTKIASFLTAVDDRVHQLTRKKELLEQYKKGVMQKIFSQEIRFRDENGQYYPEWTLIKVKDIFRVTRGNVLSMDKIKDRMDDDFFYPVYSSQTSNKGLCGFYDEYLFEDCITWTTDGANAGDVNFRQGKFYCTNVCGVLENKEGFANLCMAEILQTISKKHVSYVGNPKLMNNVMAEIEICVPISLCEQQHISSFLFSIDQMICLVSTQLENMQTWKKGLLQKMFV
jgi:type I restriction enzyme S subunit